MATKVHQRRGLGRPDYNAYRRVAYQLQASTHVAINAPELYFTDRLPEFVEVGKTVQITYLLFRDVEEYTKYQIPFTFAFGPELASELHRIQLIEPSTLTLGINQYQRWAISELMLAFFEILEQQFVQVDVADDQLFAWARKDTSRS